MFRKILQRQFVTALSKKKKPEDCCSGNTVLQKCWLMKELRTEEALFLEMSPQSFGKYERDHQRQKCCVIYVHLHAKSKLPRYHQKQFGSDIQKYRSYLESYYDEL